MIKNFYFFTATILEWKHILRLDKYKDIIIESFKFIVNENRVRIFASVNMPNHLHTVWKINEELESSDFQRDTLKYISQTMLRELKIYHPNMHKELYVGSKDREYQVWERNPLSVPLFTQKVVEQKISYIHNNPVNPRWTLVENQENYKYSSAKFYFKGIEEFGFLEHYMDV